MALYRYRAVNAQNKIIKGELEALNEFDLDAQLKKTHLELIQADELKSKARTIRKMSRRELINFLSQIEMLLRAGVSVLSILADLRNSGDTPEMRELCGQLHEKIDTGSSMSEAFASNPDVFPELVINLVRIGEAIGQLPSVMQEICRSLKWQDELAAKTKQLLIYPTFVTIIISAVVLFLMIFIVPQIVKFIANMGQEIPIQTVVLIWVSGFCVDYWWLILLTPPTLILFVWLGAKFNPRFKFILHDVALRFPALGPVTKKIILARICDTLGLTYRSGIPLLDGIAYCRGASTNLVIRKAIDEAYKSINDGSSVTMGFAAQGLFPSLVIRMLKIGEETGDLDGALKNIAYFYNRDINESIARVQAMIEPILTVVLGVILGWIMLAVLGPIYDTISKIKL